MWVLSPPWIPSSSLSNGLLSNRLLGKIENVLFDNRSMLPWQTRVAVRISGNRSFMSSC